jgi:hypothetical protein
VRGDDAGLVRECLACAQDADGDDQLCWTCRERERSCRPAPPVPAVGATFDDESHYRPSLEDCTLARAA